MCDPPLLLRDHFTAVQKAGCSVAKRQISIPVVQVKDGGGLDKVATKEVRSGCFGDVFCGPADGLSMGYAGKRRSKDDNPDGWVNEDTID